MPRPPREDFPGARQHVMNRGARREPIFVDPDVCSMFLDRLTELPHRFGARVHAYGLMPNHFHLLIESTRGNLGVAMGFLQSRFAQRLNAQRGWDGPLFGGRYRNRVVWSDPYWAHLLAYVHLNPVKAGLVSSPNRASWTSHGAYARPETAPKWLTVTELLELHGGPAGYEQYVADVARGRERGPADFDEKRLWAATAPAEAVARGPLPSAKAALSMVRHVTGTSERALRKGTRGRGGNPARWVAMWWVAEATSASGKELARLFGTSPATVTRTMARVRARRREDELIRRWTDELEAGLEAAARGSREPAIKGQ